MLLLLFAAAAELPLCVVACLPSEYKSLGDKRDGHVFQKLENHQPFVDKRS